ncbi:hypothetical protein [Solicola sp. PLA-1-18]|uniref:hypothetical protein n=1 Tax=Solicola sp. PLA-1-18 TaxID=3380532 RepID=UPI003B7E1621
MHFSNHYYGQAHVLARYCGMDEQDPPTIWGLLQHGWNPLHGHGLAKKPPPLGFPNFVWSDAARRRGQAWGWRDFVVIGATWAYLMEVVPSAVEPAERRGTIWYPFHGAEIGAVTGDHANLVAEVMETEDEPVTFCLYWYEWEDDAIRSVYEASGARVICHGRRGMHRQGTDTDFMYRQHDEISRHRRVCSNRLSTAVFYGAATGCEVGVYGDPMQFAAEIPASERKDHVRRLLPEMHGVRVDPDLARETTTRELGLDRLVGPDELRGLFGWDR